MDLKPVVNIVDDDAATRDALSVLLGSVSLNAACFASAEDFLRDWEPSSPGCVVVDLRMPGASGLELQKMLQERGCPPPLIFLTGHGNVSAAVRAMRGGAVDFLMKPVNDEVLIEKVQAAIRQDQKSRRQHTYYEMLKARVALLTPRERQVLDGVVAGHSNKIIARNLDISHKTVELHRGNMMEKMQAHSIAEVVRLYLDVRRSPTRTLDEPKSAQA